MMVGGKWRLERVIAEAATATVFEASDVDNSRRRVALKVIDPYFAMNASIVSRFLREACATNKVAHPAIVPVFGAGTTNDSIFVVTELLAGETLEQKRVRAGGSLPFASTARIADHLMSAVAAVHEAGIVHRDLQLSNVFLTSTGQVKLLARGTLLGAPAFMAPQQACAQSDRHAETSWDVWALGAILFTLLTGEHVHGAAQPTIHDVVRPARLIGSLAPSLDPAVCAVIDRALAFDAADRFASVSDMRTAFRYAAEAVLKAEKASEPEVAAAKVAELEEESAEEPMPEPAVDVEVPSCRVVRVRALFAGAAAFVFAAVGVAH